MGKLFYECVFAGLILLALCLGAWEAIALLTARPEEEPDPAVEPEPDFEGLPADEQAFLRRFFK